MTRLKWVATVVGGGDSSGRRINIKYYLHNQCCRNCRNWRVLKLHLECHRTGVHLDKSGCIRCEQWPVLLLELK